MKVGIKFFITILSLYISFSNMYAMSTIYDTCRIENVDVFYRKAGNPENPAVLLLHGFPSSSHMYRDLIPLLADDFYVVAPDFPGFGQRLLNFFV